MTTCSCIRLDKYLKMRYVSAYLLPVLGGNTSPSSKTIWGSVGIEAEDERLDKSVNELNTKEVMNSAVAAPAAAGSAAAGVAPVAAEEKEGSDDDMIFGLFD
uniref:Large ribosomal subunit protein P2 n=1 Tax=Oncorhynchus tshawytscha TaxID=74940 RepID=A0A8C8FVD2_ONCTS